VISPARFVLPAIVLLSAGPASAQTVLAQVAEFAIREANQGVGVDKDHFYAVDDRAIAKYTDPFVEGVLYGIIRATSAEIVTGKTHRVVVFKSNVRKRGDWQSEHERFKP
jgi:hypothetical protein